MGIMLIANGMPWTERQNVWKLCVQFFYYTFTSKMKIKGQKVLNHNYKLSAIVVRANYTFL